jgi:hypothetical protein
MPAHRLHAPHRTRPARPGPDELLGRVPGHRQPIGATGHTTAGVDAP